MSRRRDRLTQSGRRGARLTRRLSESYQRCTASEGNAVSRDGSVEKRRRISATGHQPSRIIFNRAMRTYRPLWAWRK